MDMRATWYLRGLLVAVALLAAAQPLGAVIIFEPGQGVLHAQAQAFWAPTTVNSNPTDVIVLAAPVTQVADAYITAPLGGEPPYEHGHAETTVSQLAAGFFTILANCSISDVSYYDQTHVSASLWGSLKFIEDKDEVLTGTFTPTKNGYWSGAADMYIFDSANTLVARFPEASGAYGDPPPVVAKSVVLRPGEYTLQWTCDARNITGHGVNNTYSFTLAPEPQPAAILALAALSGSLARGYRRRLRPGR
jgi:hypothetical protein